VFVVKVGNAIPWKNTGLMLNEFRV
jgi:hypothetical protein